MTCVAQQNILWADVAVHDMKELTAVVPKLVRGVKSIRDGGSDPSGQLHRQAPPFPGEALDELEERAAMDVLHDHEVGALLFEELFHAYHSRVLDTGGEARLVEEHAHKLVFASQVRVHHLDRDKLGEARRATPTPQIKRRHATGGDVLQNLIAGNDLACA